MGGALAALKAVRIRNKDILPALAIIAALLLLLFLSCAAMVALLLLPGNGGGQPSPGPAGPSANGTANNSGEVPAINITSDIWDSITNQNVEIACLMAARDAAGANAWAVQGCSCVETANATTKNYDCDIATLDPSGTRYFAMINCFNTSEICTIETNYGIQNITFDELAGMFG